MVVQNYVREIRRSKKLSQKELAMALGVSRQTINAIETGKYNPSLELALEIERYFDVPFHELFQLEEIEYEK